MHWNTHRWCITPSICTLPKAPPCPIPSYNMDVKFKISHQHDCSSLQGTGLLRQQSGLAGHPNRVFIWDGAGAGGGGGTQHGAKTRKLLNKGISVILRISDESSVWLTHIAPCQSLPSVCSMKIFLNAFLPSLGSDFSLPPCIPWQFARWAKMHLAITAHPHGSEGKCLVDLRCEWLHLSLLMDGSLGTCLSGGGHR